jgi:hypothetical protein
VGTAKQGQTATQAVGLKRVGGQSRDLVKGLLGLLFKSLGGLDTFEQRKHGDLLKKHALRAPSMIAHMAQSAKEQQNSGVKPAFSISVLVVIVNLLRQKINFMYF